MLIFIIIIIIKLCNVYYTDGDQTQDQTPSQPISSQSSPQPASKIDYNLPPPSYADAIKTWNVVLKCY